MRAVAIALDGVLRKELDTEAQDMGGSLLFASLVDNFRVVILGTDDRARDEQFLTINGLTRYIDLSPILLEDAPTEMGRKRAQIERLRREGYVFEFVIVPDPDLARNLYRIGIPAMLYLHPLYSREAFRPDHMPGIRAWSEIADEVDYQRTTKAELLKQESVM